MTDKPLAHTRGEDIYALATGCVLLALGLAVLRGAELVTGGVAGIALLIGRFIDLPPGVIVALTNIPFLALSYRVMGGPFTLRTVLASIGIAGASWAIQMSMHFGSSNSIVPAIVGGTLIGIGILVLARHATGAGGVGVLTLWLHRKWGVNAGIVQIGIDGIVLSVSALVVPLHALAWSVLSACATAAVLYSWHRADRYLGYSPLANG